MAIRQPNTKGKTYYFNNDLINIKNFTIDNLKLDKQGVLTGSISNSILNRLSIFSHIFLHFFNSLLSLTLKDIVVLLSKCLT